MRSADERVPHARRSFVAHHPLALGLPLLGLALVASLATAPAAGLVQIAAQVAFIGLQVLTLRHDGRLCLRCLLDAPDDPEVAVAASRRRLRWFHLLQEPFALVPLVLAPVAFVVAGALLHRGFGVLALASFLVPTVPALVHRRLAPWCPYCGWDDGDDDDDATPEPPPDPVGRATRPLATSRR